MKVQKKKSKRQPLRQKYKVERKVREHTRKVKKDARLNPQNHKKKDPGIPNLWPFKEQMLNRFKAQKEREEEDKKKLKEVQKEKKKAQTIQQLASDAQKRQSQFAVKEEALADAKDVQFEKLNDLSKRAYFKEFKKVVEASDVLLEVLDARDPLGCRTRSIEQMITAHGNKKIILVLNKIDLVPREVVQGWLKHLRNEYPTIAFKCSTGNQRHIGQSGADVKTGSLLSSNECLGASTLLQLLKNYSRSADIKTSITVGIIGYPNVGKSSLINSLNRSKAVGVGATPGFTKVMQEVQLDKKVKLLDCPGIVFATGSEANAGDIMLRNCVRAEKIDDPIIPIEAILRRCNPSQMIIKYKIPKYSSAQEFLSHIARKRGKLLKGGIPDYNDAARIILHDWNTGNISYFTHPPSAPSDNIAETTCVVSEFAQEFDINKLLEEGDKTDVMMLPSIQTITPDSMVEIVHDENNLDDLFVRMAIADEEESDDDDDEDDDDIEQKQEDSDSDMEEEDDDTMKDTKPKKDSTPHLKAPIRATDEFNPQVNRQNRKQQKKQRKLLKKQQVNQEPFDFGTDFVADNEVAGDDADDDDLLDL